MVFDFLTTNMSFNLTNLPVFLLFLAFLYIIALVIRNIYFHPLSHFPGPTGSAASRLPYVYSTLSGQLAISFKRLHENYGPVVRTAPNELSFIEPSAWKTIYSQRHSGHAKFQKNYDTFHENQSDLSHSIFIAGDEDHLRMRKVLAYAFSERALREQEPLIQGHVDSLIQEIHKETAITNRQVDLVKWYNWVAFDIVADLSFGEPFYCLKESQYRHWVILLSKAWKIFAYVSAIKSICPSTTLLRFTVPKSLIQKQLNNFNIILDRVRKRTALDRGRPDFISCIVKHNDEKGMTGTEIISNASLLIAAGTETVATLLPAATYLLATNPQVLERATTEIRNTFQKEETITMQNVNELEYLPAVINEALRLFPPVPEGLPRVTPPEGAHICGHWVPGGTFVQISPYAANLSPDNFSQPESFIPERWLSNNTSFATDKKQVHQPFSMGPRNCIGQNLAHGEMRLIIAKLLWNFDMQYTGDGDWTDQPTYMLWQKKPLWMKLSPATHR